MSLHLVALHHPVMDHFPRTFFFKCKTTIVYIGLKKKKFPFAVYVTLLCALSPNYALLCHSRRHTLSRRRIIPLPQWKANPETDPEALFSKDQLVLALYPQTTCFYRALIHNPPHRVSTGGENEGKSGDAQHANNAQQFCNSVFNSFYYPKSNLLETPVKVMAKWSNNHQGFRSHEIFYYPHYSHYYYRV